MRVSGLEGITGTVQDAGRLSDWILGVGLLVLVTRLLLYFAIKMRKPCLCGATGRGQLMRTFLLGLVVVVLLQVGLDDERW